MKKTYRQPGCNCISIPTQQPLAASDGYKVNSYETADEENLGGDSPSSVKSYFWETTP